VTAPVRARDAPSVGRAAAPLALLLAVFNRPDLFTVTAMPAGNDTATADARDASYTTRALTEAASLGGWFIWLA
jgi:hypothetical protein